MLTGRVHRILRLIVLLQAGRARSVADLMAELGVSRRTLFRDLSALAESGVPYYHEPGAGYRIGKGFFLPPINLTVPETLGLMLLAEVATAQRKAPMLGPAMSAIHKLVGSVPEPLRSACADLVTSVSVQPGPRIDSDAESQHFPLLQRCIDEGRACRLRYAAPLEPEPADVTLRPYVLHFAARAWHVIGHSETHGEVRMFKLVRIASLEALPHHFAKPRNFSARDKLGLAWQAIPEGREYDVTLRFTPKVAINVGEVRWHPTQTYTRLPDGSARVTFRVDGLSEIAWWVCGYAGEVVVEKPRQLALRVADMHRAAAGRYDDAS